MLRDDVPNFRHLLILNPMLLEPTAIRYGASVPIMQTRSHVYTCNGYVFYPKKK